MVEAAGTSHWEKETVPNVAATCELTAQDKAKPRLSKNNVTGEVWENYTGQVIGILQYDGFVFIPYTSQYEPLANRHFDSFESFNSYFNEIENESGG